MMSNNSSMPGIFHPLNWRHNDHSCQETAGQVREQNGAETDVLAFQHMLMVKLRCPSGWGDKKKALLE